MGSHPLNLTLRFILELTALASSSYWAWNTLADWKKYALAILLPVIIAAAWGCFAVPNDPSRSGKTVIATNGIIRLLLELVIFGMGTWFLYQSHLITLAWIFAIVVIAHYTLSYDRVIWLLRQ